MDKKYLAKIIATDNEGLQIDSESLFFGINADIKYLAGWLNTFIS